MNESRPPQDRLTELLRELAGASALQRLLEEVLANITPEQKQRLSEAIVSAAIDDFEKGAARYQDRYRTVASLIESSQSFPVAKQAIRDRVDAAVTAALATDSIEKEVASLIASKVRDAVRAATDETITKVTNAIRNVR